MSKRKIMLVGLGSLVALFVVLIVLASVLITPEKVRETVLPLAEKALHRKVELGAIDVSLFSGISLQNLSVRQRDGEGEFISAERVVLRYRLLALLMLKVEVDEIILVKPQLEIIRNRDGSFNFSDLSSPAVAESPAKENKPETAAAPIDLLVSQVSITDGRLLFVDHTGPGAPARHEVSAFHLLANKVSTRQKFPIEIRADWNGNALGMAGQIDLPETGAELDLHFNKIALHVAGRLQNDKIKAALQLPKTTFADLVSSVPREYASGLTGLDLDGHIVLNLDIDDETVRTSGFVVEINGQKVRFDLVATNVYGQPIRVNFMAASDSLDIDKLIPPAKTESAKGDGGAPQEAAAEIGPYAIPVELLGEVRIDRALYQGIPVTDLMCKYNLKNNILRLEKLTALIAGGSYSQSGKIDLGVKGLTYSSQIDLQGVQGGSIVKMLKPALADSIEGTLGGNIKVAGDGTLPETSREKLSGQGAIRLTDGKLQNIPALNSVAALLDIGELREVVLDDGQVDLLIKDGQVGINSKISGSKTRLVTTGQIGLDGKLDLRSQLALSPALGGRLHEQGKMARYLGDDEGWTTVPIRIKGAYESPDVGLDSKGLQKQAEKAVKQEVQKKLEKELQKKLKGLFGN